MGTIVANIREIGIFMIAAQAVMHFAPGKQYEKYIKLIASVMVLLLFVNPFVEGAGEIEAEWEKGMEQIVGKLEEQETGLGSQDQWGGEGIKDTAMQQIEDEVQSRLNLVLGEEDYRVEEVSIQLEQTVEANAGKDNTGYSVRCIRIVMEQKQESYEKENGMDSGMPIRIDDIMITSETDIQGKEESTYRRLIADTLGVEEDRVEVICRGGW